MATVKQWNPFGVSLNITATGSNVVRKSATQFTVLISASWETYWSANSTNYGMTASSGGSSATINTFGTYKSSGSGTFTGTYSISGNGSATKTITVTFKNFNSDNGDSATKNVTFSVTVPAWTSYTVAYNANGGSGAPSSQTKWKDQTLTLSSTKPTRTGYSFQGWATSSSGSVAYAAGATYTANATVTLYAVWKANTYTVSYNANGGTGAPSNQTKTYGKALALSSTKPTRARYTFLGWATSASATKAEYAAGGTYTNNAKVTLYAVWELAYVKPSIYNVSVTRSDANGNASDEGLYAHVEFDWKTTESNPTATIEIVNQSTSTSTLSGTSGHASLTVGGQCDTDTTYTIVITVADSIDESLVTATLGGTVYPIDVLAQGKGIAFGKPAELEDTADFAYAAKFNKPVYGNVMGLNKLPEIPANSDLNNYMSTGSFAVYRNSDAETIANMPIQRAGRLEVSSSTGEGIRDEQWSYLRQRFIPYNSSNAVWERDITRDESNVWTYYAWWKSSLTPTASAKVYHEQKVLWSGGMYMTGTHTINLSEAVSAQANGIVLVFSRYANGASQNEQFSSFFIPKYIVSAHSGVGHDFKLGGVWNAAAKYLYIHDTYITGHDKNGQDVTIGGISYTNNAFVLRYVLGV